MIMPVLGAWTAALGISVTVPAAVAIALQNYLICRMRTGFSANTLTVEAFR